MFSQFNIHSGHILEKNARLLSRVILKIRCCIKTKPCHSSQLQDRKHRALQCLIRPLLYGRLFSQPYKHSASLKMPLWHPSEVQGPGKTQQRLLNAFNWKLFPWIIIEVEKKARYEGIYGQGYLFLSSGHKILVSPSVGARVWAQPSSPRLTQEVQQWPWCLDSKLRCK